MKIDTGLYGDYLAVLATFTVPTTDVAVNPTTCNATFYNVSTAGALVASALGTVAMVQQNGVAGLWGAFVDVSAISTAGLIIVVTAVVAGVNRTAVASLGSTGVSAAVGPPIITAVAGPIVDEAKYDTP